MLLFIFTCSLSSSAYAQEDTEEGAEETLQLNPKATEPEPVETTAPQSEKNTEATEESTPPPAAPKKAVAVNPPVSTVELFKNDINKFIDKDVINPLMAGTDDFITLTQTDLHPTDKGVMILLPEWQQGVTSPKAINYLRQYLPTQGWTTITLQPIEKPENYPSSAEKLSEKRENNAKSLTEYKEKLLPMMAAVLEKAAEFPGIFVVISEGNNAAMLLDLFQQQQLPMPNALVMLSAHQLTQEDNIAFATKISEVELPILDLYLKRDNNWVHHFAKLRKQYANRELKTYYRQKQLNNFSPGYYPEQELAKAIKGWLVSIGW